MTTGKELTIGSEGSQYSEETLADKLKSLDKALAYIIKQTPDPTLKIYQGAAGKKLYQQDLKIANENFIRTNGGELSNNIWIKSQFDAKTSFPRGVRRPAPISTALAGLLMGDKAKVGPSGYSTVGGQFQGKPALDQIRKNLVLKQKQVIHLLGKPDLDKGDVIPIEVRNLTGLVGGRISRGSTLLGPRTNPDYDQRFNPNYWGAKAESAGSTRNFFGGRKTNVEDLAQFDPSTYGDRYRYGIRTDHFTTSNNGGNNGATNTGKSVRSTLNSRNQLRTINTIETDGGGFYGRNDNVLRADGSSTSLSINTSDRRWGNADPGEMLGVMPRRLRDEYDRKVLKIKK